MWGLPEILLASAVDELRWQSWTKTEDAQKRINAHRPRPIQRPGVKKPERIGTPMSIGDMNARLGWEVPA